MNNQNSSRKRRTVAFTPGEVAVPRRFISAGRAEVSFSVWRSLSLARRGPNRANARRRGEKRKEEKWPRVEAGEREKNRKNKPELRSLNIRWKLRFACTQTRKTESISSSPCFHR